MASAAIAQIAEELTKTDSVVVADNAFVFDAHNVFLFIKLSLCSC